MDTEKKTSTAKKKNGVIIYDDYVHFFKELPPEQSQSLIVAVLEYHKSGAEPELDLATKLAFNQIRLSIDRDALSYQETCKRNAENVRKRWNTTEYDRMRPNTKHTDKDKDKDNKDICHTDSDKAGAAKQKHKEDCAEFLRLFNEKVGRKFRVLDDKARRQLSQRIKDGFSIDEIVNAAVNASRTEYHQKNKQYLTPEFITRADKLNSYHTEEKAVDAFIRAGQKCGGISINAEGQTYQEWKAQNVSSK